MIARQLAGSRPRLSSFIQAQFRSSGSSIQALARKPLHAPNRYLASFPRGRPQYNRFSRAQSLKALWYQDPAFRTVVAAVGIGVGSFYVYHLEEAPVTKRKRFMAVSPATEEAMSRQLFQQLVHQYGNRVLPVWDRRVVKVQRVLERLIPASGMGATNWEVFVIDDAKEKNAFVIPGGKVFVFSGILPICKDDDGLAAVLGHEIAHNVAHHAAERMSSMYVLSAVQIAASFFGIPDFFGAAIIDLAFSKPGTRKQEAEADYIGLLMMAESCYDPRAAVEIWRRMEEAQRDSIPQFLSTHPSNENRRQKILEWLPQAELKREASECEATSHLAKGFQKALGEMW